MSIEATVWAVKYAPPMKPEYIGTLVGLAEHADTRGRGAYPSIATLAGYACKSERSVKRDLKGLLEDGLIRRGNQALAAHLPSGKRPTVYDLAMERFVPGGRAGDDEDAQAARAMLAASRERGRATRDAKKTAAEAEAETDGGVTPTSPGTPTSPHNENPSSEHTWGDAHVTRDAHVTGDAHVHGGVTPTSGRGDAHVTQTLHEPSVEPKDSSAPAADSLHAEVLFGADGRQTTKPEHHLEAFGAFWTVYPKKRDRGAAKKAWIAAIEDGVDPQRIVAGAQAYARERATEDPKYTKYPATWLNKGCWDDEPDPQPADGRHLRAVAGGYQPWRNPEDQNAYYDSL